MTFLSPDQIMGHTIRSTVSDEENEFCFTPFRSVNIILQISQRTLRPPVSFSRACLLERHVNHLGPLQYLPKTGKVLRCRLCKSQVARLGLDGRTPGLMTLHWR